MDKFKFEKDNEEYSTSKGRVFKYFFNNGEQGLLQIGETDDYFYFTIMLKEKYLKDSFTLVIEQDNLIYEVLNNFIKGFETITVKEEGSPEQKTIGFKKIKNKIEIVFGLTEEEKVFFTIELANLRRLGDTRFAELVPTKQLNEQEFYEMEFEFRYKFKARIHRMLDELDNICENFTKEIN